MTVTTNDTVVVDIVVETVVVDIVVANVCTNRGGGQELMGSGDFGGELLIVDLERGDDFEDEREVDRKDERKSEWEDDQEDER